MAELNVRLNMKKTIITCTLVSVLLSLGGLALFSPTSEAQQRFHRASNKLERVADGMGKSDGSLSASTEERLAIEQLYMLHAMGRGCLWMAVLFSSAVFVIAVVGERIKLPNQSTQPPRPPGG